MSTDQNTQENREDWLEAFKTSCVFRLSESLRMLEICREQLEEEYFWARPNPSSNSIGNLLLHLSGNLKQYLLSGLAGAQDTRERDREFLAEPQGSSKEVWELFLGTLDKGIQAVQAASAETLLRSRTVQGFELTGMGMVVHAVEHLSYHTGQIAFALKLRNDQDLGFYKGVDLNIHND